MKIKNVVIINDFDYVQGGASKVAIDTANLLVNSNKNLNVYYFSACHSDKSTLDKKVVSVCTNQFEFLNDKNRIRGFFNGLYNFKSKRKLKKLLLSLDKKETIVHVHGWTKALSSSVFDIAFKLKYKLVLTMHDYFTACPNGGYFNYKENKICHLKPLSLKCIKCNCDSRNYFFKLYRILRQKKYNQSFKKLKNVISISDFSLKVLKNTLPKNINIARINNPIDFRKNKQNIDFSHNDYYLYVGRVSKEKGVDLFCEAITQLNLLGIVVGDGNQKIVLQKKYPNIKFVGWKSEGEVKEYMKNAKCLIMPSRLYEVAPLTNLEALSVGVPSLVSITCAASDVNNIKNNNGDVFDVNVEDLKTTIQNFNIKTVNNNILLNYSSNIYVKKIIEFYNELIEMEKKNVEI